MMVAMGTETLTAGDTGGSAISAAGHPEGEAPMSGRAALLYHHAQRPYCRAGRDDRPDTET